MISNEKIGVGILTYNRKDNFKRLVSKLMEIADIDVISIVKDKNIDYGYDITKEFVEHDSRINFHQSKENSTIAKNKNVLLKDLIGFGCEHLFIIEDDMIIVDNDVFNQYIETAKSFNLKHLNFCAAWDSVTKKYLKSSLMYQQKDNSKLDIYNRLCGCFSYFTKECIESCGFYDESFNNGFEHVMHTLSISSKKLYTPYGYFADVHNSSKYLNYSECGKETTLNNDKQTQFINVQLFGRKSSIYNTNKISTEELTKFIKQQIENKDLSKFNFKYSILTYIFNNYEKIREVEQFDPNCEYVLVTDDPNMKSNTWKIVYDEKLKDMSPFDKTFYVRYHPFEYVSNDIVVKMDGNILVKKPLTKLIHKYISGNYDVAVMPHPLRYNILEELQEWCRVRNYPREQAMKQIRLLETVNYNPNYKGLIQATLSIERNNKVCRDIREMTYSLCKYIGTEESIDRLDQTIYTVILNKFFNHINVLPLSEQVIRSDYLTWYWHNSDKPNMNIFYDINKVDKKWLFDREVECYYL